jgi:hypothetical protein
MELVLTAIQKEPQPVDHRIPNSTWSGYGLSHSGPAPSLKGHTEEERNLQVGNFLFTYLKTYKN